MTEAVKQYIADSIKKARRELNRRLSEAHVSGLKVEVDVLETHGVGDAHPRPQVEIRLYEKIE